MSTLSALRAFKKKHVITLGPDELPVQITPPGFLTALDKILGDPVMAKVAEQGINSGLPLFEVIKSLPGFVHWAVEESITRAADAKERMEDGFKSEVQEFIGGLTPVELYEALDGIKNIWMPEGSPAKKKLEGLLAKLGINLDTKTEELAKPEAASQTTSS